jgi:hypothetical protein
MSQNVYDNATLQAIGELLALGEQHGFGITFEPDSEGWTVGYMQGMGGGDLVTGYDLGDTGKDRRFRSLQRDLERVNAPIIP